MKRLIAAMSLVAFVHSAFADATYGPPETNNTERALPDVPQTERSAEPSNEGTVAPREQAELDPAPGEETGEETESAATGDGTRSDGESAAADSDSESPADIHL